MMSALLKPLLDSEVTTSQVGRGEIFYLSASGGLDGPLVTEPKFTHSKDFVS